MDLIFSLGLLGAVLIAAATYAVHAVTLGPARFARVASEGAGALLDGGLEMLYWSVVPVASAIARAGVTADAVTWASLVFGLAAGGALASGHFGLGACLALVAGVCDAVDGFVARATGTASPRGEVLDAGVDRYVEFAVLSGIAVSVRHELALLVVTLGAIVGSFMVSYSSACAEAHGILPPRGAMRRPERLALLILGACLTPLASAWRPALGTAPMGVALTVVAVFGNLSALQRLAAVRDGARPCR